MRLKQAEQVKRLCLEKNQSRDPTAVTLSSWGHPGGRATKNQASGGRTDGAGNPRVVSSCGQHFFLILDTHTHHGTVNININQSIIIIITTVIVSDYALVALRCVL